jgi:2-oxoacid:acceptor oxidoreductase gamma subunit (pyruvate/2-ketoisovalerate family)
MIEVTLHGRGGQGGVTLAKLIATAFFLRGKWTQAFGVYAAERSGAPVQAYVRIDESEITNHNQIREPNHLIVLDATLIGAPILAGLDPMGWVVVNASEERPEWRELFAGRRVALVDASGIAVRHGLGTAAVPIVNTTLLGAVARALGLDFEEVRATLADLHLGGANVLAAREAFDAVTLTSVPGVARVVELPRPPARIATLLDADIGGFPTTRTGTWATRSPHQEERTPPCNAVCPAGNDVRGFIDAISDDVPTEALRILMETSALPGVCGRVCPAPCMDKCNRGGFDEAVNVRDLERYAADFGRRPDPRQPWRKQRVAVVGSGPAGLSASYHMARLGYPVTLLEASDQLGGVLRNGIPGYRLPKYVLDREIDYILDHGVTVFTNERVDRATLHRLAEKFDAVFVATGLQQSRGLDLGHSASVIQGIDFLDRVHRRELDVRRKRVVVIGGGNTAIDAARSAIRLGAAGVRILYRRSREEMPAIAEEIESAVEEGVALQELALPVRIEEAQLSCVRMKLGERDASGRRTPLIEEGSEFSIPCDLVVLALGQEPDYSLLADAEVMRDGDQRAGGDGRAPVILGGDLASNEGTVAAAMGTGMRSAWLMHRALNGEDRTPAPRPPVAGPDVIRPGFFAPAPRQHAPELPVEMRARGFHEVRANLSSQAAALEASRCFSCGVCSSCDICLEHCPDGLVTHERHGYAFDYDYCKGCGICGSVCPRGVIAMT